MSTSAEPTPIMLSGLARYAAGPSAETPAMPTFDVYLWRGTWTSTLLGLVAQAVPQVPPQVSWAAVALAAVGSFTLAVRLTHSYFMARLEADRLAGENRALKAELAVFRAARPPLAVFKPPSEQ